MIKSGSIAVIIGIPPNWSDIQLRRTTFATVLTKHPMIGRLKIMIYVRHYTQISRISIIETISLERLRNHYRLFCPEFHLYHIRSLIDFLNVDMFPDNAILINNFPRQVISFDFKISFDLLKLA